MDEGDSDTVLELSGRYYFKDNLAVTAKLNFGSDFQTLGIGIRTEF
jgi:hypothetical protein